MFRFFKNIINTVIIILAVFGVIAIYHSGLGEKIGSFFSDMFSMNEEKVEEQVGDFSKVDTEEFKIDKAVNVLGYKTVIAKHPSSGQKMVIVDSGKKTLLTEKDIQSGEIKDKLNELSKKVKYKSTGIEDVTILNKGYMTTYGQKVPYVKFSAKLTKFPYTVIYGIISVVDSDKDNQRLIVSVNDKKHYSQLVTSEFYKSINESKKH